MSLAVVPEWLTTSATDVTGVGSAIEAANAAAMAPTTGLLAAAEDEVSAAIAALFSAHGHGYQAISAQAALFHDEFVQALSNAGAAYTAAEAANAAPLAAGELTGAINTILGNIFGTRAAAPFGTGQLAAYTGTSSLATKIEVAAIGSVQTFIGLPGVGNLVTSPSSPLLQLVTGDNPLLNFAIGNTPPPWLTALMGETFQVNTFDGMRVVQITPAHPTGDYVVAIHGGAYIFPPSIFHWLDYTVMANQTGATIEVPIYPLLQQGGTAGTVVPQIASFISSQVTAYGAPRVSVIGDSAGGNLALAGMEYMIAHGETVPASMVLLSPWLDLGMTNPNISFVHDPLLPVGLAPVIGKEWAGGLSLTNPTVSPLYGSLSGLPPTTVYSGNLDILSPDVLVLQQMAANAHAPFNFVLANGEIHDFVILTFDGPKYWAQIDQELGLVA